MRIEIFRSVLNFMLGICGPNFNEKYMNVRKQIYLMIVELKRTYGKFWNDGKFVQIWSGGRLLNAMVMMYDGSRPLCKKVNEMCRIVLVRTSAYFSMQMIPCFWLRTGMICSEC